MIARWHAFIASRSLAGLSALIAMLVVVVALADFATGPSLSFSIFYVVPVALASWYGPRPLVVVTCLVSTITWLGVEVAGIAYDNALVPTWNAAVRLAFFALTSVLLVALKAALHRQQELAEVDSLTKVLNRRAFEQRCGYLFQVAVRRNYPVTVCYLDIDGFKKANDVFGHQTGDRILVGVAASLTRVLRDADIVARIGGDEFAFALADAEIDNARRILRRILTELREAAKSCNWPVGFSIGAVVCRLPFPDLHDALHHADRLMYDVKSRPTDGFLVEPFEPQAATANFASATSGTAR